MRWVLTGLLAWPAAAFSQEWKDQLEVFDSVKVMQAPEGYQVLSALGGRIIKDVAKGEPVNTKAVLEFEGRHYYMSDWSWTRYQNGHDPYWILLRGEEEKPEVAEAPVAAGAAPGGAGAKEESPEAERPLSVEEKLEKQWAGELEVFPSSRDIPAPKGYKLLATPDKDEKPLRSTGTKTSISVQAALTRKDGLVYYISDWSWSRAKLGKDPSWMLITGSKPKTGAELASSASPGAGTGVAAGSPPAASLVEKVKQMTRPKVLVDSIGASGRMVALLVGNGRYSSVNRAQQMLDLEDSAASVELLGRTLRGLNVEVREEKDLNRDQLTQVIQETANGLHPGDVFFFFYAGHGLQLSGENFLVPLGINFLDRRTVKDTAYPMSSFWKAVSDRPLRFVAVFLDGCRKNPFNTKDSTFHILSRIPGLNLPTESGTKPGLLAEKPPRNALVCFAAEPGMVVTEAAAGPAPSRYASALAAAWAEDVEMKEALDKMQRRVSEGTVGQQTPWVSAGDAPRFYLHTPGRSNLDPDQAMARAGEWVSREQEKGLPIALGLLARSVRERPAKNPATAGLLFLLGYQSIPVPVKSWGPFPAREGELSPEMQLSIDGRYVALFASAKAEKPELVLDREKGEVISEAYESFAPGFGRLEIASENLGGAQQQEAGEQLSVISFRRKPDEEEAAAKPVAAHAMTPLLAPGELVASFHDEGLERVFLLTRDVEKELTFWEYATTPPVGCREDFRVVCQVHDLAKVGTGPIAAGAVPEGPEGPAHAWSLVFDSATDQIRFLRGTEETYRREGATRPDRCLEDWRLDEPARRLALIYRDHVDVLSLAGGVISAFDLPAVPAGVGRRVLSFNAAFRRLALAWGPEHAEQEGNQEIAVFDLSTGQRTGGTEPLLGYAEFARMSSDQEWFFYYDAARRIRLVDMVTGGARIHLPGTATLHPLPVGAGLEPNTEAMADFPAYELRPPPLTEGFGEGATAPPWLADLAEALIGFQVNQNAEVDWFDDMPKRLQAAVQQMKKRPGDGIQAAWAKWLMVNRLGLEDS